MPTQSIFEELPPEYKKIYENKDKLPFFLYFHNHTYCNNAIKFVDEFGIKKYVYLKKNIIIKKLSKHYKLYKYGKLIYDFNWGIEQLDDNINTLDELKKFYNIFDNIKIEHFKLENKDTLILVIFECQDIEFYNKIKLIFEDSNYTKLAYELRDNMRWAFYKIVS